MKKWHLIIIVLTVILSGISCSKPKTIPPAATSEIFALSGARIWLYGKYVEVKTVEDRSDYCYIMIYIKSLPGEATSLNEGLDKAKVFTITLAKSAVDILKGHDINQDVSVWAQLPLKGGGVEVLGHARYDAKHETFHEFERLEP